MHRRLAAILAADIVGYSGLMGADQDGTIEALRQLRAEVFGPAVAGHGGELVKSMGDSWLVEFSSTVDAVTCAMQVQDRLAGQGVIRMRIGIHLGNIVHDDEDIFGDGVNVAARLEALAEPGAVVISDAVHGSLDGTLRPHFNDEGERSLKNIDRPIRIWSRAAPTRQQSDENQVTIPPATYQDLTGEQLELPDRPSIAVLAFRNLGGDPGQDHLAEGIAQEIISVLARVTDMVVMSSTSSFAFKDRSATATEISRELGVRYVLEGTLRVSGTRMRLSAQLVDATTGETRWADRYDRMLDDIFEVQDQITRAIVEAMAVALTQGEELTVWSKRITNFASWELLLRGIALFQKFEAAANAKATALFRDAISADTGNVMAKVMLVYALRIAAQQRYSEDAAASIAEATSLLSELASDHPRDASVQSLLSFTATVERRYEEAIEAGLQAVLLARGETSTHAMLGLAYRMNEDLDAALAHIRTAMRLSP